MNPYERLYQAVMRNDMPAALELLVEIRCGIHGVFRGTPPSLPNGGCSSCARSKFKRAVIQFAKLNHQN